MTCSCGQKPVSGLTCARCRRLTDFIRHRAKAYAAIFRCTNPKAPNYTRYGGRGIKVHEPWVAEPKLMALYLQTLPGAENPDLVLDRINNDGHYEPGNLRFVTQHQLNRARSSGRKSVKASTDLVRMVLTFTKEGHGPEEVAALLGTRTKLVLNILERFHL